MSLMVDVSRGMSCCSVNTGMLGAVGGCGSAAAAGLALAWACMLREVTKRDETVVEGE